MIQLPNGLVLRFARASDVERVVECHLASFFLDGQPDYAVAEWTRDLMSGKHPTTGAENFTIVEDTHSGKIVSSLCLIPQTWTFDGIPFGLGRVEIVSTRPAYRKRGLVRAQFEVIHKRSAALGHLAQGITGIPHYYRQFGYEYALDLGGWRSAHWAARPSAKAGEAETLRLRPPVERDVPFVMRLAEKRNAAQHIAAVWDETYWRWRLFGQRRGSAMAGRIEIIESRDGQALGYVGYSNMPWEEASFGVFDLWLDEGVPWGVVAEALMPALKARLVISKWEPPSAEEGDAAFPPLVFLKLLFGHRSLAELKHAFPDCWTRRDSDAEALLNALFPKYPTRLISVV